MEDYPHIGRGNNKDYNLFIVETNYQGVEYKTVSLTTRSYNK
jgi:hypothetical protein